MCGTATLELRMRISDFLTEYDYGQTVKSPGKSQYAFQTAKGMVYTVFLKRDSDSDNHSQLIISFTTTDPRTGKSTNERTGTGDSIAVFRTVQKVLLNHLRSLPKEQLPDQLIFIADGTDSGRVKLYSNIAHSNRIPGYRFYTEVSALNDTQILFVMQKLT